MQCFQNTRIGRTSFTADWFTSQEEYQEQLYADSHDYIMPIFHNFLWKLLLLQIEHWCLKFPFLYKLHKHNSISLTPFYSLHHVLCQQLTHYSTLLCQLYRFLQGPETDQATVSKVRDAIREQREITVQLINYTKSGKYVNSISWCCKCAPFLAECHNFLINPWILEREFIICLQIFYDTIFGRTRYCPLLKT